MSTYENLQTVARNHPCRLPGSSGLTTLHRTLMDTARDLDLLPEEHSYPIYEFRVGLRVLCICAFVSIVLGLLLPVLGLLFAFIVCGLAVSEWSHPLFAKISTIPGQSIFIKIPARSKETQNVVITAHTSTEGFLTVTPSWLPLVSGILGLIYLLLLTLYTAHHSFSFLGTAFLPPLGIFGLTFLTTDTGKDNEFHHGLTLISLGNLLKKAPTLTTSVYLHFKGAQSHSSGSHFIKKIIGQEPKLTFELTTAPDPDMPDTVAIIGSSLNREQNQDVFEILQEVSRGKNLPVTLKEIKNGTALPFIPRKIPAMILEQTDPGRKEDQSRKLRELLAGLLRHLDQPRC